MNTCLPAARHSRAISPCRAKAAETATASISRIGQQRPVVGVEARDAEASAHGLAERRAHLRQGHQPAAGEGGEVRQVDALGEDAGADVGQTHRLFHPHLLFLASDGSRRGQRTLGLTGWAGPAGSTPASPPAPPPDRAGGGGWWCSARAARSGRR